MPMTAWKIAWNREPSSSISPLTVTVTGQSLMK